MIMGFIAYLKTQFILHLLISFVFIVSGLIINFIQLCTLVFWPINKQLYRRVNCRLSYSLWSQLVMLLEWWSGTECTLFTDKATVDKFGKEHAIVILNHNFEIDFLCGWTICERFGVLGILLYCEGTRFTEKKHQISMQVAESKCLPKLKYHLLPRTKGFTTTMQCLKGTVSAVYDVTLNFKDKKNPSLLGILYGKKYEADMSVRRFPVEDIPEDEKECANWLHKLYQEKDALQEDYENEGCFPGAQYKPPRRPWTVLNFLFWATVLLSPLINFAAGVFVSGSPLLIIGFILFIGIACFAVRRLIGVTEIEKGSSYGNQEVKKKN
ncbi:1-acyl-sn-glycerol-3-phosphate acyltransferase gamma isoform X2 [Amia ocellicauda]|uniref:1-acyl-sn-glycerol-3-phosphate acyltransferase gamma isoform X2 n=1 Tax=Amia ocellicauda TaxID=2972642 RepID=UPI003463F2F1